MPIESYLSREKGSRFKVLKVDGDEEGAEEEDQAEQVHIRIIVCTLMGCSYHGTIVNLQASRTLLLSFTYGVIIKIIKSQVTSKHVCSCASFLFTFISTYLSAGLRCHIAPVSRVHHFFCLVEWHTHTLLNRINTCLHWILVANLHYFLNSLLVKMCTYG